MLPEPRKGQIASAPWVAIASPSPAAMRSSASSQEIRTNSPLPFGPTRRRGWSRRSGDRA
jgi:hypothetical protein